MFQTGGFYIQWPPLHRSRHNADIPDAMRAFYIVVQRGHEDLYEALRQAFSTRPGFHVLIDRRTGRPPAARRRPDRRNATDEWGSAHFVVGECEEPFGN